MSKSNKNSFNVKSETRLIIDFESPEALNHFKSWLCEQGEQDYWEWMRCREEEESGNITVKDFDYWKGNIIPTDCGRITED